MRLSPSLARLTGASMLAVLGAGSLPAQRAPESFVAWSHRPFPAAEYAARRAARGFEQCQRTGGDAKPAGPVGEALRQAGGRIETQPSGGHQGPVAILGSVDGRNCGDGRIHGVSCTQHSRQAR